MISVIIPTLNEESTLAACLSATAAGRPHEIIVVDGGSEDGTVKIAKGFERVILLEAPKGRATQMNAAATRASGEVLLFCHADTLLPEGYKWAVETALGDHGVSLGAFRFRLPKDGFSYRIIEWGVSLRCRFPGYPYGDQAFFCRKADFDSVGGFAPPPALEDIDLVRKMRRRGRVVVLSQSALTSDRAWRKNGILNQSLMNYRKALRYFFVTAKENRGSR